MSGSKISHRWRSLLLTVENASAVLGIAVLAFALASSQLPWWLAATAGIFLAATIAASVHNADVIAHRIGAAKGTIVLALCVTIIEVALIVSLMSNGNADASTVARDTVFSAIMIVTNGILGVCMLLGGWKHRELSFQTMGTNALLAVLLVLVGLTLILPNFTATTVGPTYNHAQLLFVSAAGLLLYVALLWSQTRTHREEFSPLGVLGDSASSTVRPSREQTWASLVGLVVSLVAVVGLAKVLSPVIRTALLAAGAPASTVGIALALLVLAPETLSAIRAARGGHLQTSLNLAIGSGVASIALTIPVVSIYSIVSGVPLTLGLDPKGVVFVGLTFLASAFTVSAGRTTALHGCVHLALLAGYLVLSFIP